MDVHSVVNLENKTKQQLITIISELRQDLAASSVDQRDKLVGELSKREEYLNVAQKNACIGSWDWDIVTGEIYWSEQMFAIMELEPGQGDPSYELALSRVHPEDRDYYELSLKKAMEKSSLYDIENRLLLGEGRVRYMHSKGVVELDHANIPVRMFGTVQDITEHKHLESRLRQSEKLQATGLLAGKLAHDFKNQLVAILMFSELARRESRGNKNLEKYIDDIETGARHSLDFAKSLLGFMQDDEAGYSFVMVDVNELLLDIALTLAHIFPENIKVTPKLHADSLFIEGSPPLLRSAVLNMALNSRDAMPDGGEIVFSTERTTLDDKFIEEKSFALKAGEYLKFAVQDTGAAMNEEARDKLFAPFFSTKAREVGSGLGMASVYEAIKLHGGAIEVASRKDHGTCISIYLPISSP